MKIMRKITIILALLLVSMAFVGAVSAASEDYYSDYESTSEGSLVPGQTVEGVFKIDLPKGTMASYDTFKFTTPLSNAKWEIKLYKWKVNDAASSKPSSTILGDGNTFEPSAFEITYPDQYVTLFVSLSGKVSTASAGKTINVVRVVCSNSVVGTYSSIGQVVYNPSNLNTDIKRVNTDITETEKRIAEYSALGIDTSVATREIASAKSKISAAQATGSADIRTAYINVDAAEGFVTKAERALALSGLNAAKKNIDSITSATNTLSSRGWDTEAVYLKSEVNLLESEYKGLKTTYDSGKNPDTVAVDELVKDSYSVLDQANKYLEDSKVPVFVKFLPIIIGVIVAIAAVIGVIFLIRRKNNRWDELG